MKNTDFWKEKEITRKKIDVIQINLGDRCNQECGHCHINGSPSGNRNMDKETAIKIIEKFKTTGIANVEFTGGTPEMNPNLKLFIEELSLLKNITVRSNLTVLSLPEYSDHADLYKKYNIKLVVSLPCYTEENVNKQRGKGVFQKSIAILKKLNTMGFGTNSHKLDIVYNPGGPFLPGIQKELEKDYKKMLNEKYNISFNNLITITNVPINRFKKLLEKDNKLNDYMDLLKEKFNPLTLDNIMCRYLVSVDYKGELYDGDFNLAMDKKIISCEKKKFWEIDFSNFSSDISFDTYCYACTAGSGSSCHGALT